MDIEDLTDKDLENFIQNYRAKGVVEGGIFSLAELMLEKLRRGGGSISGREITIRILELAQKTPDGLITYGELWKSLYPEKDWVGHANVKAIGADLGSSVHYCVLHGLPVVSVLVTRQGTRKLSDKAMCNIYDECKELGVDTGPSHTDFVQRQAEQALKLTASEIPE